MSDYSTISGTKVAVAFGVLGGLKEGYALQITPTNFDMSKLIPIACTAAFSAFVGFVVSQICKYAWARRKRAFSYVANLLKRRHAS